MAAASPRRVVLGGLLRGRELEGDAMVTLDADSLSIDTARGRISLALSQLEGIRVPGDVLELYLATGDVIQLEQASDLNALATEIASNVCAIPEMTRSLRALGAGSLAADSAKAKELAAGLQHEPARWLTIPGSDFALSVEPPKVVQKNENLEIRFDIPEGAARLLLQHLAKAQPAAP